jgi:hypothetical protein
VNCFKKIGRSGLRDLTLDKDDNVYFSEATGASGDGHIYRLRSAAELLKGIEKEDNDRRTSRTPAAPANEAKGAADEPALDAKVFYTVSLRDMQAAGGNPFWTGNFAFGRDNRGVLDTNTLYISAGNLSPSALYRTKRKGGAWTRLEKVFDSNTPIMGLVFTSPREAYYLRTQGFAGINQLFRLTDLRKAETVLTLNASRAWHVAVVPEPEKK